jgi:hypothetical protein
MSRLGSFEPVGAVKRRVASKHVATFCRFGAQVAMIMLVRRKNVSDTLNHFDIMLRQRGNF